MKLSKKSGITVTSIVVYVILFFVFTTVTTLISSRFNKNLFDDRGKAINITAINKLEYNLLDSADKSYYAEGTIDGNKTTITFSNSDVYEFDSEKQVIYKNGGKLVNFVKDYDVRLLDDIIDINVTLNKYTNEVARNIKVSVPINSYEEPFNLIAHYDGINNTGTNEHSDNSMIWKDLSSSDVTATLSSTFTHDDTNGWTETGLFFPKSETKEQYNVIGLYNLGAYPSMTFEMTITFTDVLGTVGNDYVWPIWVRNAKDTVNIIRFGIRQNIVLMYGSGFENVFSSGTNLQKDERYTLTFVQEDLTTRKYYLDGKLIATRNELALSEIEFPKLAMYSRTLAGYVIHSVRIYNKALSQDEILSNYNNDILRFGE